MTKSFIKFLVDTGKKIIPVGVLIPNFGNRMGHYTASSVLVFKFLEKRVVAMETYWIRRLSRTLLQIYGPWKRLSLIQKRKKKKKKTKTKTYYSSHKIKQVSPQPVNVAHVLGKINMWSRINLGPQSQPKTIIIVHRSHKASLWNRPTRAHQKKI